MFAVKVWGRLLVGGFSDLVAFAGLFLPRADGQADSLLSQPSLRERRAAAAMLRCSSSRQWDSERCAALSCNLSRARLWTAPGFVDTVI